MQVNDWVEVTGKKKGKTYAAAAATPAAPAVSSLIPKPTANIPINQRQFQLLSESQNLRNLTICLSHLEALHMQDLANCWKNQALLLQIKLSRKENIIITTYPTAQAFSIKEI